MSFTEHTPVIRMPPCYEHPWSSSSQCSSLYVASKSALGTRTAGEISPKRGHCFRLVRMVEIPVFTLFVFKYCCKGS